MAEKDEKIEMLKKELEKVRYSILLSNFQKELEF